SYEIIPLVDPPHDLGRRFRDLPQGPPPVPGVAVVTAPFATPAPVSTAVQAALPLTIPLASRVQVGVASGFAWAAPSAAVGDQVLSWAAATPSAAVSVLGSFGIAPIFEAAYGILQDLL